MKLYIFGCSFSKYFWPTWADILVYENPNIEVYNYSVPGIGNERILYRINEIDELYQIKNEKIIVVWTSWHREDRYFDTDWSKGNVFNSGFFCNRFLTNYWSEKNDILKNINQISLANKAFKIDLNGSMMEIGKFEKYKGSKIPKSLNYSNFINDNPGLLEFLPNLLIFDKTISSAFDGKCDDKHPDILGHLSYYIKVKEQLNLKLSNIDFWINLQTFLSNNVDFKQKGDKLYQSFIKETKKKLPNWKEYEKCKNLIY